jgi:hypothetical protein
MWPILRERKKTGLTQLILDGKHNMANYKWTKSKIEKLSELYKAGEPRRFIQEEIGCTAGVLAVQMAKMPATRQPIDNAKFAQIEANFFQNKRQDAATPIRL